ncbi:DUF2760 domain-containing protein [bacterium]|nr:DUF2760 domain-containing protein [bacterium]
MSEQQRSFAVRTLLAVLVFNGLLIGALYVNFADVIQSGFLFGLGLLATVLLWVTLIALGNRFVAGVQRTAAPAPTPVRETPRPVAPKPEPKPEPKPVPAPPPSDAAAIQILSILQRKGRLIDFLQENLSAYDDAQIGAAVRNIHAESKAALAEHVTLEPIYADAEGSSVTVQPGFDANAVRLVGNVTGEPPFRGTLVHRGWRVAKLDLPKLTSDKEKVIAPAEVEIG